MDEHKQEWANFFRGFEELFRGFADVRRGFVDVRRGFADVRLGFEDSKRRIDGIAEDSRRRSEEVNAQIAKTDAQIAETDAQLKVFAAEAAKRSAELDARMAAMKAEVAGIGASNGMFAEDVYYRSLWMKKEFAGIRFDDVSDRLKSKITMPDGKKLEDEFDIVMTNASSVALIETKYRAREKDVKDLAETAAKNFRTLFPAYKDFAIYLGLGALSFDDKVVNTAKEYGIGLIRQVGDTIEVATDWEVKAY